MGVKMEKTAIIVTSVVGSLGVLSAIFGFSAEGTKLTPYTILTFHGDCIYPPNPALALAVCGIIFLLLAQITISAVSGCCGCCKSRAIPSGTKRIVAIVCAVFSWIAALVACVLLGVGASWNANVVRIGSAPFCPHLKDGILAGGGVLTLAATALGITSFILLRNQPAPAGAPPNGSTTTGGGQQQQQQLPAGFAIGHPQFPPAAANPSEQLQFHPNPQEQEYGQAQVAPTTVSHAMAHAPPQMTPHHFHPQGSHAPNQQYSPPPPLPAKTAPLPAPTGVQSFSPQPQFGYAHPQPVQSYSPQHPAALPANTAPLPATTGVQSFSPQPQFGYAQPQSVQSYSPQHPAVLPANTAPLPAPTGGVQSFSPQPQVGYAQPQPVQSYSPQYPAARPQAYVQAPAVPPVSASQGLIINAGANLLMRVAEHALSSDDTAAAADPDTTAGDVVFVLPSSTGDSTTQDGGQDTNRA